MRRAPGVSKLLEADFMNNTRGYRLLWYNFQSLRRKLKMYLTFKTFRSKLNSITIIVNLHPSFSSKFPLEVIDKALINSWNSMDPSCILWLLSISFVKDYYIVLIKYSENKRSKFARIPVRKKLGVDFDKPGLSQQTVGTIFQKSFVPENIHIGRGLSMKIIVL